MKREALSIVILAAVVLVAGAAAQAQEGQFEYVGSKSCKKCHLKEYKSWEATKMAQTFETLKPGVAVEAKTGADLDPEADYTTDAACVKCHVTGYGEPGGFDMDQPVADQEHLLGVGCEMCHGPGGTYIQDGYMTLANKEYKKADLVAVGMVDTVGEAQCVNCHNSESPFVEEGFVFDFEAVKDEGMHENFPLKYSH